MEGVLNMRKIKLCALFLIIFLAACAPNSSKSTSTSKDNNNKSVEATTNNNGTAQTSNNTSQTASSSTSQTKSSSSSSSTSTTTNSGQSIAEKVKAYILTGQENKPEAQKIKWSKTFLDKVDIDSLYKKYTANGGKSDDLDSFADYITKNAPIPSDWKDLATKDINDTYGEKAVRFESLGNDLYQVYINKDGSEKPYVVVSARTGYFHG